MAGQHHARHQFRIGFQRQPVGGCAVDVHGRRLHRLRAGGGDDAHAVPLALVHVHQHVAGQVGCRDLDATGGREHRRVAALHVVLQALAQRRIGRVRAHEALAVAPAVDAGQAPRVQRVHQVAALEPERFEHVPPHVGVEALARHPLHDRPHHVVGEVGVFVALAGRTVGVAVLPVAAGAGVDDVEIAVAWPVGDRRGVVEQHPQRDRPVGEGRVAHREADQVAGIVVQRQPALLHQLHHRGGRERLGDRGDAEQVVGLQRNLRLQVLPAEAAAVDDGVVPGHHHRQAHGVVLGHQPAEPGFDIVGRHRRQPRAHQQPGRAQRPGVTVLAGSLHGSSGRSCGCARPPPPFMAAAAVAVAMTAALSRRTWSPSGTSHAPAHCASTSCSPARWASAAAGGRRRCARSGGCGCRRGGSRSR